jgi:outer membrane scaffolding protein for murein synthesis (MipA/OmpV family)
LHWRQNRAVRYFVVLGVILCASAHAQDTLLGAGLRSRPAYDGSARQENDLVPVLRYYGSRWFARTTQGILEAGARNELDRNFWAGVQLAYEPDVAEAGVDAGVSAGLHLEWDRTIGRVPVNFLIRARQHLDADLGGQADLRVTAGVFARGGFLAGAFGQATWGTRNAVASRYGPPDSGLLYTSIGLLGSFDLGPRWLLVGSLERRQLRDEVAKSALVERTSNYYASAGLAYRFAR